MSKVENLGNLPEYTLKVTPLGFNQNLVLDGIEYKSEVKTADGEEFDGDVELGKLLAAAGVQDRTLIMELILTARQAKMLCCELREVSL